MKFWNSFDNESAWVEGQFVDTVPSTPTATNLLIAGETNPTSVPATPYFSAVYTDPNNATDATAYEIEVNTASDFTGTVMWDSTKIATTITSGSRSADINYGNANLTHDGTTYYVRMRFWNGFDNYSAWVEGQFTDTVPSTPTATDLLTSGSTNPTTITDPPYFSAIYTDPNNATDATAYQIEVNTAVDFSGTVMWDSTKTAATITSGNRSANINYGLSNLSHDGTTYYVRMKFWNSFDNESAWVTGSFVDTVPSTPTATSLLTSGSTNPTTITDPPYFSATYTDPNNATDATHYQIEVNTAVDFSGTVMWDSTKTATTITSGSRSADINYGLSNLSHDGTTYYVRMKFWNSFDNESAWVTGSFVDTVPSTPTATNLLTSDATNPSTITDPPYFSAIYTDPNNATDSTHYQIEVNTASDFTGTVMWDTGKLSTTITSGNRSGDFSYTGTALSHDGTTYYVRMKFWNSFDNDSAWVTGSFVDTVPSTPTATSLLTCDNTNPSTICDPLYFSAIYTDPNSTNSTAYEIEVNTASDFTGTVMWDTTKLSTTISSGQRSSDFTYSGTSLTHDGTTYYVRMRFWNDFDTQSDWVTGSFVDTIPTNPTATSLLISGETNPSTISEPLTFSAIYTDPNSTTSTAYEIEVNTASDFTGTVMWDTTKLATSITSGQRSSDFTYDGTALSHDGTTYYVRMRFWDGYDLASTWVEGQFTDTVPSTPTATSLLTSGSTNPTTITDPPYFSAIYTDPNNATDATHYQIEVNTASDFTGTVMWDSTKTATTITSGSRSADINYGNANLTHDGTTYYIRMKFWNSFDNESAWVEGQFTDTVPSTPTATSLLTSGETNPTTITDPPYFSAIYTDPNNATDATHYQIEVNTASNFSGTVMWDSTKTATTITSGSRSADINYGNSNLTQDGTTYYVRMKFWNSFDNESAWVTGSFVDTVPSNPTATSLLTAGETNPTTIPATPYFSAVYTDPNSTDSTAYEIEVNTNSEFTGTVMWDTGKLSTTITSGSRSSDFSYTGNALSHDGTTYYVRMKFWNTYDNASDWVTGQFVDTVPTTPTATSLLTSGSTNPTTVTDPPYFSAVYTDGNSTTASAYQIEVNTASDFTGTVMWDSSKQSISITSGSRSADINYGNSNLTQDGTTYYVRMKFWNGHDVESAWVEGQFVDTVPSTPTATSLLTSGETNPTMVTDPPYFSAIYTDPNNSTDATAYQIEVNTASDFSGTVMWDSTKTGTTITSGSRSSDINYGNSNLTHDGTTYYVRMKFWNSFDTQSDWVTGSFVDTLPTAPTASSMLICGQTDPTEICNPPYFSAIYTDSNGTPATAYQIEVNSASDFTGTVMWNTGKVTTSLASGQRLSNISYDGTALADDGTTYYVRMKFWDSYDLVSEPVTGQFVDTFAVVTNRFWFDGLKLDGLKLD
jgi:hypothetical protein